GRRPVILASYLCGTAALLVMAFAGRLWHFWTAAALLAVVGFSNNAGLALVTDLLPLGRVGRGLAVFRASFWVGGIAGFAAAGLSIRQIGLRWAMLAAALLPVAASILLTLTPLPRHSTAKSRTAGA
ncbi:MAG: MFS transporter, partial [Spirochaetales bacterium]|nr:MFS transporter [Spirochaetales bacterium]